MITAYRVIIDKILTPHKKCYNFWLLIALPVFHD